MVERSGVGVADSDEAANDRWTSASCCCCCCAARTREKKKRPASSSITMMTSSAQCIRVSRRRRRRRLRSMFGGNLWLCPPKLEQITYSFPFHRDHQHESRQRYSGPPFINSALTHTSRRSFRMVRIFFSMI